MFSGRLVKRLQKCSRSFSTVSGHYDAIIIGGGIAGAAAAVGITCPNLGTSIQGRRSMRLTIDDPSQRKRVLVLESEPNFCYHSTGRSAAIYSEVYGSPSVRALSTATKPFFYDPVVMGVSADENLVYKRSTVWTGTESTKELLHGVYSSTKTLVPSLELLTKEQVHALCPWTNNPDGDGRVVGQEKEEEELDQDIVDMYGGKDTDYTVSCGMLEPDAADMDVNEIWNNMMRVAKINGTELVANAMVHNGKRTSTGAWMLEVMIGQERPEIITADLLVNAAGAWADPVADVLGVPRMHITPKQRTIIQFSPEEVTKNMFAPDTKQTYMNKQALYPSVMDIADRYYYKPDAGRVLASPCDQVPVPPHDAVSDKLAQAVCIDRLVKSSALRPQHIITSWAGLRCFTPDHEFVLGQDAHGVFWVAGLGGYGIQTAFGNARYISGLVNHGKVPEDLLDMGLQEQALSPLRTMQQ